MALGATMVWEARTAGDLDNGGGFTSGGTDHSQQDAAFATRTDLVIGSAGSEDELSSAGDNFAADDVGNVIHVTAGSGFTVGWYEVLSVAAGVATVDRNVGTADSTSGTGQLGGAVTLAGDPDAFLNIMIGGHFTHLALGGGTYTVTADVNVAADGDITNPIVIQGYNSTRGDNPSGTNRPLLACGAFQSDFDNYWEMRYIRHTSTDLAGFRIDTGGKFLHCSGHNSSGSSDRDGITLGGTGETLALGCEAVSDSGHAIDAVGSNGTIQGCYMHDSNVGVRNGGHQFRYLFNIFDTLATAGILSNTIDVTLVAFNTFHDPTIAISETDGDSWTIIGNIFEGADGTAAVVWTTERGTNFLDYNNFFGNTTDVSLIVKGDNDTALDPAFVDPDNASPASNDFAVGTNMKATGFPGAFSGSGTTGFLDQGAVQREEPAGGGGGLLTHPGMTGGMRG